MAGTREEVHASMKIGRKETGQASESSDHQSAIASKQREKMRIDIIVEDNAGSTGSCSSREKRFKSVMDIELEDSKKSQLSRNNWRRIPKVPQLLRGNKDLKKQFEPRVVSVGPCHHHKHELKAAEKLKRQVTKRFILRSCQTIEVLHQKILNEIPELRNCYKKNVIKKYNNDDLAWMMLVDGCSLLHYIHCYTTGKLKELPFKHQNTAFVQQDLFLLENQLPFRVLELLLMESKFKDKDMQTIEEFICLTINVSTSNAKVDPKEEKPSHLLDLPRRRLLGTINGSVKEENKEKSCHLLRRLLDNLKFTKSGEGNGWNSYRNVKELKSAGIHFKPSKSHYLRGISFKSYLLFGLLRLPKITIDDSTKSRFLNLIAYEMLPEAPGESEVTSYICFLDSLIDEPEDVKELGRKGVLRNFLGSDEEVATLFNEITTDLVLDSDAYKVVKEGIQKHYKFRVGTWMAQGYYNHFSSPWTILAFVGAIVALIMSGVQTYFTIYPRGK